MLARARLLPVIFLDVGTHEGHTLEEVTKPGYGWDAVHGFEPMPAQWKVAHKRFGKLADVHPFGLWDRTGQTAVYGDNTMLEASIFSDKDDVDADVSTVCGMVRATEFFDTLPDTPIVMKLNCEGAEVPILLDLCDSGRIHQCHAVMIDFDCRRVSSLAGQDTAVLDRLRDVGFDRYQLCEHVMVGDTHQQRIAHWLQGVL